MENNLNRLKQDAQASMYAFVLHATTKGADVHSWDVEILQPVLEYLAKAEALAAAPAAGVPFDEF